ncbi:MAG: hypothetical protein ABIR57_02740, partial [Aeromicrobium sp.]
MTATPVPNIAGSAEVGETMSAYPGTWEPSGVAFTFQWIVGTAADRREIPDAVSSTYTPAAGDVDKTLSVRVTGSKAGFTSVTMTSAASAPISPGQLATSSLPEISGTPQVGKELQASPGGWDPDVTLGYQWLLDGLPIGGETGTTYVPVASDVGKSVSVRVTGTKPGFATSSLTSVPTQAVAEAAMTNTPTPTISGVAQVGKELTAEAGRWDSGVTLGYQWLLGGSTIGGATGATYSPVASDVGEVVSVRVTGSKPGWATTFRTSVATSPVVEGAWTSAPKPTISGQAKFGSTLLVAPGTWTPEGVALAYQWLRDGSAISGATETKYVPDTGDIGKSVAVRVTGSKPGLATTVRTSDPSDPISADSLTNTPTPTISGTPQVGKELQAQAGSWDPDVTLSYQWLRDGNPIDGATNTSYVPVAPDVGKVLSVRVTGSKPGFVTVSRTSDPTDPISADTLTNTPTPTISGVAQVGKELKAEAGSWDPDVTLSYQWQIDGSARDGATNTTYVPVAADVGKPVSLQVAGSRPGSTTQIRNSTPTDPVIEGTLTNTPMPTVSGLAKVGSTLVADAGTWSPEGVALAYQWLRDGNPITDETSATHTVVPQDAGTSLSVSVTGSKSGMTTVVRTSTPTATVVAATLTNTPTPAILGMTQAGNDVKAEPGSWDPGVTLDYQWLRNGAPIAGETSSIHSVTSSDAGRRLSVSVTGSRAGYSAVTKTSAELSVADIPYEGVQTPAKVARALQTFHAALASAGTSPVDVFVGPSDSLTEGYGATSVNKRWISIFRDDLRRSSQPTGVTGGLGYLDLWNQGRFPDYPVSVTNPITEWEHGLGSQS